MDIQKYIDQATENKVNLTTHDGPCVYFLYLGDEIVYVGASKNNAIGPDSRVSTHLKNKKFDGLSIIPFDCPEEAYGIERKIISTVFPRYNQRLYLEEIGAVSLSNFKKKHYLRCTKLRARKAAREIGFELLVLETENFTTTHVPREYEQAFVEWHVKGGFFYPEYRGLRGSLPNEELYQQIRDAGGPDAWKKLRYLKMEVA